MAALEMGIDPKELATSSKKHFKGGARSKKKSKAKPDDY
jgi:hypothetical protein